MSTNHYLHGGLTHTGTKQIWQQGPLNWCVAPYLCVALSAHQNYDLPHSLNTPHTRHQPSDGREAHSGLTSGSLLARGEGPTP